MAFSKNRFTVIIPVEHLINGIVTNPTSEFIQFIFVFSLIVKAVIIAVAINILLKIRKRIPQ
ncbi:MAG: hypothetical protein J4F36_13045 [Nitrosopumilaceae archaeon]|nr:hypothetical protein [Nitrosopumilaceae archaeon]